jgi:DNA-binding XRE family transcriptional regulator
MKRTSATPQLKAIRERLDITQEQAGEMMGVDIATIWRWENWGPPKRGLGLVVLARFIAEHGDDVRSAKAP